MNNLLYCPIPSVHCCDSCHQDEAYDFSLQWNSFLYCCCTHLREFSSNNVDIDDENAVREFIQTLSQNEVIT
jgi:hypothetical protein